MTNLEKIKRKFSKLVQYKDKTEEELTIIAQNKLYRDEILDGLKFCNYIEPKFSSKDTPEEQEKKIKQLQDEAKQEKQFAESILDAYLEENTIESTADRGTLRELIDNEVLLNRYKNHINKLFSEHGKINDRDIKQVQELEKTIQELKEKLGLTKNQKKVGTLEQYLTILKKKVKIFHETHGGLSVHRCPHCGLHFKEIREKIGEESPISMLRGTIVYNKDVFDLVHEKTISEEKAAKILGVSISHIKMMYTDIYLKELK